MQPGGNARGGLGGNARVGVPFARLARLVRIQRRRAAGRAAARSTDT